MRYIGKAIKKMSLEMCKKFCVDDEGTYNISEYL